jgi:hypothetical protein
MGIRNILYEKAKIIKELTFKGNIKICSGRFEVSTTHLYISFTYLGIAIKAGTCSILYAF